MPTELIPNAEAGRAMATPELVKVDPDELRQIAADIHVLAESVTADCVPCLTETQSVAAAAAAEFTAKWQPDSKYAGIVSVWDGDAVDYSAAVAAVAADMTKTASALAWIADNFQEAEQASAESMESVAADDILLPGTRPRQRPETDVVLPGTRFA